MLFLLQKLVKFVQNLVRIDKIVTKKLHTPIIVQKKCSHKSEKITFKKISSTRIKKAKKRSGEEYYLTRPEKKDFVEILKLMNESYYTHEPTSANIKPSRILDKMSLDILHRGYSIVAKSKYNHRILGASINSPLCPWEPEETHKCATTLEDKNLRAMLHYYSFLYEIANVWKTYDVPVFFDVSHLFIHPKQRQRKMGINLLAASRNFAGDCGFKVVRVDATNYYTSKMCEKLGMKLLFTLPYTNFVNEKQQPIFKPKPPHDATRVYIDDCLHEDCGYPKIPKNLCPSSCP